MINNKTCSCSLSPEACATCANNTVGSWVYDMHKGWTMTKPEIKPLRLGWICPVCRKAKSPDEKECCMYWPEFVWDATSIPDVIETGYPLTNIPQDTYSVGNNSGQDR